MFEGIKYWAERSGASFITYSAPLTGITVSENSQNLGSTGTTYYNQMCKLVYIGSKWYLCAASIITFESGPGSFIGRLYTTFKNLTDDGAYIEDILTIYTDSSEHPMRVVDIFTFGTAVNIIYYDLGTIFKEFGSADVAVATGISSDNGAFYSAYITNNEALYPGTLVDGNYVYYIEDNANDVRRITVTSSWVDTNEIDSELVLDNTDIDVQLFGVVGDLEIIMDAVRLQTRWRNGNWQYYSILGGSFVNGVIWTYNYLGIQTIAFILWGNIIREVSNKGTLKNIQALEPRDYKKIYLSNTNENVPGVVQFQNQNGDDDLRALITQGNVSVIELLDGNKNIIEFIDDDGTEHYLRSSGYSQIYDSFEFKMTNSSIAGTKAFDFRCYKSGSVLVFLRIYNGHLYYLGNAGAEEIGDYSASKFDLRVRVDFECDSGAYLGLAADTLNIWVNGTKIIAGREFYLNRTATDLDRWEFVTEGADFGYIGYVSFIGILSEGFVLGSNNKINAFVGYSALKNSWDHKLTFLTNEAITGIVQWGTEAVPDYNELTIDLQGGTVEVVNIIERQINPLVMIRGTGNTSIKITHTQDEDLIYEWKWRIDSTARIVGIYIRGDTDTKVGPNVFFNGGANWAYQDSGGLTNYIGKTYVANQTYDCKIVTTHSTQVYHFWVDDVDFGEQDYREVVVNGLDIFSSFMLSGTPTVHIDVIGISANKYVSGSNNEFPLLTFEKPWFATGDEDTGIMELALKDYDTGTRKALVQTEIYKAPECALIRTTEPFEDEWAKLNQNDGLLFYGGKVKDNNNDNRFFWIYLMKSWQDEFSKAKINERLEDYTYKMMWEFILDKYSKYLWYGPGINGNVNEFTPNQISGKDDDFDNADGTGCESTYQVQKAFLNGFLYNVFQQFDNGNPGTCDLKYTITGKTVFSGKIVTDDITKETKLELYEGATRKCYFVIQSSNFYFYDGTLRLLTAAVNNTIYHWALVVTSNSVTEIYLNGIYVNTYGFENDIIDEIDTIRFRTGAVPTGYYTYHSQLYTGNSIVDAMHTFSSISPLLTDTHLFDETNQSLIGLQKTTEKETGYIVSVRPSGQLYVDQYGASGKTINANESNGITFQSKMQIRNEKFSFITFYGGFVNGKQIVSEGFGEPNFGNYEDWFPEINGKDADDIYYDASGSPKSHRLDTMVTDAIVRMNIKIKKQIVGKRGDGMYYVGQTNTYNNDHYKVANETWHLWRKNIYNGKTDDNRIEIADSFLSPTAADPDADPISKITKMIDVNAEDIVKNSQNVGYLAERVRSRDIIDIYLEQNQRNLDESVLGIFIKEVDAGVLNSGSPLNPTIGRHRVMFVIITASDFTGTITITGDTVNRTDSSDVTVGDTEDITIDSLSTDNSSTDAESNDIHEFLNVFISDKWFQGSIVISTTDLTITDIDVYAILYHQFDSYKLITLDTLDFTAKTNNVAAWFYQYLYLVSCVNTNKKYDIENLVAQAIPVGTTVANKGYRARDEIDRLIDGNAGHGIWLELFFGPNNLTYWNDIFIVLSALLDSGTN